MEDDLESGKDEVLEHAKKLLRATEKPTPNSMTEAGKVRMDKFEKERPNVQPLVECPKLECGAVGSFTKPDTARWGRSSNARNDEVSRATSSRTRSLDYE